MQKFFWFSLSISSLIIAFALTYYMVFYLSKTSEGSIFFNPLEQAERGKIDPQTIYSVEELSESLGINPADIIKKSKKPGAVLARPIDQKWFISGETLLNYLKTPLVEPKD